MVEKCKWYYLTNSLRDKVVHTFSKGINPKVNVIARLNFELVYFVDVVRHFSHYVNVANRDKILFKDCP